MTPLPYKIVQGPKMVVLLSEGNTHSYRRFFLDGRGHPKDVNDDPSYTGDSTGKWDGDTLAVDNRRRDLGHLEIAYTLDGPKAFTKQYTLTRVFTLAATWELQEYVCQAILDGVNTE
jgi:hypothetical protein